jgi:hypothetical protein
LTGKREKIDEMNEEDIYDPEKRLKVLDDENNDGNDDSNYDKQQLVEWMKAIANNEDTDQT